ncbi:hypothetical protein ON010_g17562 [Phytophthora cinnamomi]|nr:hypothetical protein ON010_g17562 [Phytophthora cinnamomi]
MSWKLAETSKRRHRPLSTGIRPFKESVVIKLRCERRLVRPASTVASLQSKSSVEQDNAPDDFVLGLDGTSEAEPEVMDLTGRDAGDGFRFGVPSEKFWKESLSKRFPLQQKLMSQSFP